MIYHVIMAYQKDGSEVCIYSGQRSDLRVESAKIVDEKNCIPSLSFKIYPDNPGYEKLIELVTLIKVFEFYDAESLIVGNNYIDDDGVLHTQSGMGSWDANTWFLTSPSYVKNTTLYIVDASNVEGKEFYRETLFDGRVLSNIPNVTSKGLVYREIICEGVMGYLCDSVQPYMETTLWEDNTTASGVYLYVQHLLEVHNATVEDEKKIYIGTVDADTYKSSDNVYKGTNWQTTWDIITDKLIDVFGGEVQVKRSDYDNKLYFSYSNKLGKSADYSQPIMLTKNIIDARSEPIPTQVITRLHPLGAHLEDEEEGELDERLTIADAKKSGGKTYIDDELAMSIYGVIEGTHEWEDVTIADNLYTKAVSWLEENNAFPVEVEINAYDLSTMGYNLSRFNLYDYYYVDCKFLDVKFWDTNALEIVKRTIDINEFHLSTIVLGDTSVTLSEAVKKVDLSEEVNDAIVFSNSAKSTAKAANMKALAAEEAAASAQQAADEAQEKIKELDATIEELMNIVDNTIETYFEAGAPTLDNYPANQWEDEETKAKHVGDLYYDSNNGYCYRFALDTSTGEFLWVLIQDNDITEALGELHDAIEAQEKLQEEFKQYKADTDAAIAELPSVVLSEAAETFTTKTETAVMQSELQASISANAAGIDSLAERLDTAESELGDISITYATKSELTQTAGEINTKVSSVEVVANTAASDAQEALEKATEMDVDISALTDRMTTAESEISQQADQIASTVTKAETAYSTAADAKAAAEQAQAAAEDAADAAAQAQADIDNLAIGSRNILRDSESVTHERFTTDPNADEDTGETFEPDPLNDTLNRIPFWEISEFGRSVIGMNSATDENTGDEDTGDEGTETEGSTGTGTNIIFFADYEVRDLTTACDMAFSFVVESLSDDGETTEYTYVPFGELVPLEAGDDSGGHIEMHFEVTEAMVGATGVVVSGFGEGLNDGCIVIFAHAQMEQGTIASTWVAAPEDEIAERDAQIDEMDSRYSELTTELSSRIEQNADSIDFVLNETISGLTDDLNNTTEIVNELSSYVRITMDEDGNPLLELGALQNALKALLSNTELGFYDDNVRVAYISNQMLHIDSAEIVGELNLGDWIWRNTSDGGLGLKYVG